MNLEKTRSTGKPCKRGHISPRWISNGRCCDCTRESTRRSMQDARAADPDKFRERDREQKRAAFKRDPERVLAGHRRRYAKRHGVPEPTRLMPSACESCEKETGVRLMRDHDHATGAFRGWICRNCNVGIGNLGDNAEGVARALAYLEKVA